MQKQKQTMPLTKENPKRRFHFGVYVTVVPILFFAIAYLVWIFLQKPVMADLKVVVKKSKIDAGISKESKIYQGKYLSFSYPGDYQELTHTTPEEKERPIRETIFLSATDLEGQKIAIVVEERETGNFEESPSFQMRLLKPKEYVKESISENGFKGFIFKKNTQVFEEAAFIRKGNFIISVSLSSPMSTEGLNKALVDVLRSLKWEK